MVFPTDKPVPIDLEVSLFILPLSDLILGKFHRYEVGTLSLGKLSGRSETDKALDSSAGTPFFDQL